jgi:predicted branched-subunit amino acid permease
LSDEANALASHPAARDWGRARILFLQLTLHLFWVASVTAGALGGTLIPDSAVGLDFAMTALFVVFGFRSVQGPPGPADPAGRGCLPACWPT